MERPGQDVIISFFRGTCPPEEEKAVRIYLAMNIDKEYVDACLHEAFPDLAEKHDAGITIQELNRVWNKIEDKKQAYPVKRLKPRLKWYAYAAAIAFVILSSTTLLLLNNRSSHPAEIAWQQVSAASGSTKIVELSDSSVVTLFPGSAIRVPDNFNQTNRKIKLTGRAFFKVAHNTAKPFYVTAQGLTTKVLGTSFEINTSARISENIITLHTGKISISFAGKEIARLTPNQQINFNKTTGHFNVVSVNASSTSSWLTGELDYDQASLRTIFNDLEQWYGIKITTNDPSLLNQKVTIGFKGLPIKTVLNMLSKSATFTYTITDKQIIIKERSMGKR